MRAKLTIILPALLSGLAAQALVTEATLSYTDCRISSQRPFYHPLDEVDLTFDRGIKLFDGATATVLCDGVPVATATSLEAVNHEGKKGTTGSLVISFEKQNLPLGKSYVLSIPQGILGWTECHSDIQIVNRDIRIPFFTPEDLGEHYTTLTYDSPVEDSDCLSTIYWSTETEAAGEPMFSLYREDEKVGEYPAYVAWDWDLGQARPVFEELVRFDKGVHYRLVLPAGSVRSIYRDDIVNKEVSIDFLGYYTDPAEAFSYKWCSLYSEHPDVLGEVTFTYDRPVSVAPGGTVQLWEGDAETMVKEVTPWLDTDINCWKLVCDFGGIPLTSEKGYTLVIPEGAVTSQNELGTGCAASSYRIHDNATSLGGIPADTGNEAGPVYDLHGRKILSPAPGSVYIRNGKKGIAR